MGHRELGIGNWELALISTAMIQNTILKDDRTDDRPLFPLDISVENCLKTRLFAVVEPLSSNYSQNTRHNWIAQKLH
jgi:hypothetical protein